MPDPGKCRSCGADIVWIKMQSGKANPCDAARVRIVTADGRVVSGYISHFATCEFADKHRRRDRVAREGG